MAGGKGWLLVGVCMLMLPGVVWAQGCAEQPLHTEFFTDPTARGYSTCSTDGNLANPETTSDTCVQQKLNAACTDNACKVDQIVTREHFYEIIDSAEYAAMLKDTTAAERKDGMMIASNIATFNMALTEVRDKLQDIFPQGKAPITNQLIKDMQKKNVPRCEIVCKKGSGCSLSDVSLGLRGTP